MWSKILLDPSRGFQDYWSWRECWSKVMHSARQAWMRIKLFCSRSIHLSRSHLTPFMMNVALRLGIHLACLVLLQAEEQTCSDSAPAPGAALLQAQPRKIKLWKKTGYVLTRSHTFVLSWQDYQCYLLWQACSLNSALPCHFWSQPLGVINQFCVSVVIPTRPGMNTLEWGQSSLRFDRKQTNCSCYLARCPSTLDCFHRVHFLSRSVMSCFCVALCGNPPFPICLHAVFLRTCHLPWSECQRSLMSEQ